MTYYIVYSVTILLVFIINYFFFNKISKKFQLVDTPNIRKKHLGKIALSGGMIIFTTFCFAFIS